MNDDLATDTLSTRTPDYVTAAAKAALGAVPFAGSLLAEIAGSIIPNQRIERIVSFARELESKLSEVDQRLVRSQLTNENFTDLMEEALRQVARSVSQERRARIAALIVNGLKPEDVSYVESKHLLRILGEVNDIELIRLTSHLYRRWVAARSIGRSTKTCLSRSRRQWVHRKGSLIRPLCKTVTTSTWLNSAC